MYTLITFATQWGTKHGGINTFNTDFLTAFGFAYSRHAQAICLVSSIDPDEVEQAEKSNVKLISLPYSPESRSLVAEHGVAGVKVLRERGIEWDRNKTVWLGHDRITGKSAVAAAKAGGGRSVVIHHMSYDHYESYAENSKTAHAKTTEQTNLFQEADLLLAIGPLLRDSARDLVGATKPVHMLIPGLADVQTREAPATFVAFMSGRIGEDTARIKQGHLGIAAFAAAERKAIDGKMPEALLKQPKLLVRGVNFETEVESLVGEGTEKELKDFAERYAKKVVNLHTLPYTYDRNQLHKELAGSSVALMPSWHEGFGLVAWEAIAAGIPLILSENSGVYYLLKEAYPGTETGYVNGLLVSGKNDEPYFRNEDLEATVKALLEVARDPARARKKAGTLRNQLSHHDWAACAKDAARAFEWDITTGSVSEVTIDISPSISGNLEEQASGNEDSSLLKMPISRWRPDAGFAISQLLRAEEGLLRFDSARQPDIYKLNEWLDGQSFPLSITLFVAAGGQGKTRLALELCKQRELQNWQVGFLESGLTANEISNRWESLRKLDTEILIVVDYAETRQSDILALIKANLKSPAQKSVRILLLAREGGEWWDNLPSRDSECETLLGGYATTGPYSLSRLYSGESDRSDAFRAALKSFSQKLRVPIPNLSPDLNRDHLESPLYLQIAALLTLYGEKAETAESLTKALLNHERRYWTRLLEAFGWAEPERRAELLLGLATLSGGFAIPKEAKTFCDVAGRADINPTDFNTLFRNLAALYPGSQGLEPLRPDLLGEALIAQALLRPDGETLLDAVLGKSSNHTVRRNALSVIARLSSYRPDLDEVLIEGLGRQLSNCYVEIGEIGTEPVGRLADLAEYSFRRLSLGVKSQVAGLLEKSLPDQSLQFSRFSCSIQEFLTTKSRTQWKKKPTNLDRLADLASHVLNYSTDLQVAGRYAEACKSGLEAINLFKELVRRDRFRFEPGLANSLSACANSLRDVGRYEEALALQQDSLAINKRLAHNNPNRFEAAYSMSLTNCAISLTDFGRYEEALVMEKQSLAIDKRLTKKNPDRFEPDYAVSLTNCAGSMRNVGRYEEALALHQESLAIYKRLTQKNPDRFEPHYAGSLTNCAISLSDVGRYDEAHELLQESLAINKRLSKKNPDRFETDYAGSLTNCAISLSEVGRYDEAHELLQESLAINKRLTQKNPDRFETDYAGSLTNYASSLSNVGRYEEALALLQESLAINKRLAQRNPDRFETDYASSLNNCAISLSNFGRYEEALVMHEKSLAIKKRLVERYPIRFSEGLFFSLYSISLLSWLNGVESKALGVDREMLLKNVRNHRVDFVRFHVHFLEGCQAQDLGTRTEKMIQTFSLWSKLPESEKRSSESEWLCAARYCADQELNSTIAQDWSSRWQQFANQRNCNIPYWMLTVARRLEFEWPALDLT